MSYHGNLTAYLDACFRLTSTLYQIVPRLRIQLWNEWKKVDIDKRRTGGERYIIYQLESWKKTKLSFFNIFTKLAVYRKVELISLICTID